MDKINENNGNGLDFERMMELIEEANSTHCEDPPKHTSLADKKESIAKDIAKVQEMLDKATALAAQSDLPEYVCQKAKETQHFGEKLLDLLNYYMKRVEEAERRKRLKECQKELDKDKNV